MIQPKDFYRKLDRLLAKIGKGKTGKEYLFSIVEEIEKSFGNTLNISNGRIYEEGVEAFELIGPPKVLERTPVARKLVTNLEAVQSVFHFGSYIFDDPSFTIDSEISNMGEYTIPAAFTIVRSPEERWVFVFELKSGWVREVVEFFLNAVRSALNIKLFSEALKNDLEQAAHIQKSLLPSKPPVINGFDIAGRSQPAELVGGDLYDYFHFSDRMFGISIGDASGHGLPAALLVRDVVTGLRMGLEEQMKMVHTLKKLNHVIYRSTLSTRFVSLFYGEIETNGNVLYSNAGHPSPLLVHRDSVSELKSTGMILGAIPEIPLERAYTIMQPNSTLIMYSDGLLERENHEGKMFGVKRLKQCVIEHQGKSAQQIVDEIFATVHDFGAAKEWDDDATVVVVKRLEK